MSKLLNRIILLIIIGFALIVVINRGFVIRQWSALWSTPWGIGVVLGSVISFSLVVLFLLVFPGLYLWFGKTIVIWMMIGYARHQIAKQIIPQFLNQLSVQIWTAKLSLESQGGMIRTIRDQRLQKFPWHAKLLLKMSMKRIPILGYLQEQLATIDLQSYETQQALQDDLQNRVDSYLQKPQGSHIGRTLAVVNIVCLLVVWGLLVVLG